MNDDASSLIGISTDILRAELIARQQDETFRPECGSGAKGVYNTPFHVAALFLILILSILGELSFPLKPASLLLTRQSMRIPHYRPTLPFSTNTASLPLPLTTLWHRGAHRNRILPSSTNRIRFPDRSMSTAVLERTLSCNARPDRDAVCVSGDWH